MQATYSRFDYRIDLSFCDYKLAIEVDENECNNINIDYEIKTQKSIGKEVGFTYIKIGPNKYDFDTFKAINEIFRHIKQKFNQSTKEKLIKFQRNY